jgi:glycosyltransferase involved in cell wall biosynthesis
MKHVLIFEPHASGHRPVFVRYLLESMERHGAMQATWLVLKEDLHHPQIVVPAGRFAKILTVSEIGFPPVKRGLLRKLRPLLEKQFRYMRALKEFIIAHRDRAFDFVFVPFIDDYGLAPLAIHRRPFLGLPWGGIAISPRFHLGLTGYAPRRTVDAIERALYALLFRPGGDLHEIFTIDPFFADYFADSRLRYVPDPAVITVGSRSHAPKELALAAGDITILVYGNLDWRKGIPDLLAAFADPRIPQPVKLLLVGVQHDFVRSLLAEPAARALRASGRLIEINRVVSDEEESAVFEIADIVWNFYPGNYGPSGVLVRAGQASKPVVCTQDGYCGRVVAESGMGIGVKEGRVEDMVQALLSLVSDRNLGETMGKAGFDYFSKSSPSAFADPIVASIAQAPGAHP